MKTNQNQNRSDDALQNFTQACRASYHKWAAHIDQAKDRLMAEFADAFEAKDTLLNHALNQADALAWQTAYPHLVFPVLAVERVEAAARWHQRQQFVQQRNFAAALSF
jgi:hypothetical protein